MYIRVQSGVVFAPDNGLLYVASHQTYCRQNSCSDHIVSYPSTFNMSDIIAPHSNIPVGRLGTDGPLVPKIGLGLMGMSVFYGAGGTDEERFRILDRALELGETFWDSEYCVLDS